MADLKACGGIPLPRRHGPMTRFPASAVACGDTEETNEEDIDANSLDANSRQLRVRGRLLNRRWQRSDAADQREWFGCSGQAHLHVYSDGDNRQSPGGGSVEAHRQVLRCRRM